MHLLLSSCLISLWMESIACLSNLLILFFFPSIWSSQHGRMSHMSLLPHLSDQCPQTPVGNNLLQLFCVCTVCLDAPYGIETGALKSSPIIGKSLSSILKFSFMFSFLFWFMGVCSIFRNLDIYSSLVECPLYHNIFLYIFSKIFVQKSVLPAINAPAFLRKAVSHPFTFNLFMSLGVKCILCRQCIVESSVFCRIAQYPLPPPPRYDC